MTKRLVMAFVLFTLCFCGVLQPVYAWSPFQVVCNQGGTSASATCSGNTKNDPLTGPNGVLTDATKIIAFVGGVAAVIVIIFGGFRYITSGGDPSNVATAKNTVVNAVIGLLVIALSGSIIAFVISKI